MLKFTKSSYLGSLVFILAGMIYAPYAIADDEDDVLAFIQQYGDLENDLEAQAKLMRPDRTFITGGVRQTDEAKNMANQIASRKAGEAMNGGKTKFVTTIEGPIVSFTGTLQSRVSCAGGMSIRTIRQRLLLDRTWVTLVLVKERGEWRIKHTHQSPLAVTSRRSVSPG